MAKTAGTQSKGSESLSADKEFRRDGERGPTAGRPGFRHPTDPRAKDRDSHLKQCSTQSPTTSRSHTPCEHTAATYVPAPALAPPLAGRSSGPRLRRTPRGYSHASAPWSCQRGSTARRVMGARSAQCSAKRHVSRRGRVRRRGAARAGG